MARFLASCQFKYGGIAKAPGEHPGKSFPTPARTPPNDNPPADPYHTYLSLAALSIYLPSFAVNPTEALGARVAESWYFEKLDPLLNAREETAKWARKWIPARRRV